MKGCLHLRRVFRLIEFDLDFQSFYIFQITKFKSKNAFRPDSQRDHWVHSKQSRNLQPADKAAGEKAKIREHTKQSVDLCTCPAVELMYARRQSEKTPACKRNLAMQRDGHGHLCNVQQREKLCTKHLFARSLMTQCYPSLSFIIGMRAASFAFHVIGTQREAKVSQMGEWGQPHSISLIQKYT